MKQTRKLQEEGEQEEGRRRRVQTERHMEKEKEGEQYARKKHLRLIIDHLSIAPYARSLLFAITMWWYIFDR